MIKEDEEHIERLKRSKEKSGEIQPVLYTEDGRLADGYHRLKAGWESKDIVKGAKGRLGAGLIRVLTNTIRRSPSEDDFRLLGEALRDDHELKPGEIGPWIIENTGLSKTTVNRYLPQEFKSPIKVRAGREAGVAPRGRAKVGRRMSAEQIPPRRIFKATVPKEQEPRFYTVNCPGCGIELATNLKTTKLWIPEED